MTQGDAAQITSLIQSIGQYKNFKNMAKYNISCLLSYITPPAVGWRENIATAVANGGIQSIVQVLQRFPQELEMIKSAIDGLSGLTHGYEGASMVAANGGVEASLQAMLSLSNQEMETTEGTELAEAGCNLLEKLSFHDPKAILSCKNAVPAILNGLITTKKERVKQSCARVIDSVGASKEGQESMIKSNAIEHLLVAIKPNVETSEETLKPIFRQLERFTEHVENVRAMRELDGVEAIVYQLESHPDNENILRVGGRVLAKVAAEDIVGAVDRLKRGGMTDHAKEFTISLLANLALQKENIDAIVSLGAADLLVKGFEGSNTKTQVAAARTLTRIAADNKDYAKTIIDAGVIPTVVRTMQHIKDNEELAGACTALLSTVGTSSIQSAAIVHKESGFQTIIESIKMHPEYSVMTLEGLRMIGNLAAIAFPVETLVQAGAVESILASMVTHMSLLKVQLYCFSALVKMLECTNQSGTADAILKYPNGISIMMTSMETHRNVPQLVVESVHALSLFLQNHDQAAKASRQLGLLNTMVSAVYTLMLDALLGNREAQNILNLYVSKYVKSILQQLVVTEDLRKLSRDIHPPSSLTGDAEASESSLMKLSVFAMHHPFALTLHKEKVAPSLYNLIDSLTRQTTIDLVLATAVSVDSLARAHPHIATALSSANVDQSMLSCLKVYSKHVDASTSLIRSLCVFAGMKSCRDKVISEGIVDAIVSAMRANSVMVSVNLAAFDLFYALACTKETSATLTFTGATRCIIKTFLDQSTQERFEMVVERGLEVLYRIVSISENQKGDICMNLRNQGAMDACAKAMEGYPQNENIQSIAANLISRLLEENGIRIEIQKLRRLGEELDGTKAHAKVLQKLGPSFAIVGALTAASEHVKVLAEERAIDIASAVLHKVLAQGNHAERAVATTAGFRAIGALSSVVEPANASIGLPLFMNALRSSTHQVTIPEKVAALQGVRTIAVNEHVATLLVGAGAVPLISEFLMSKSHESSLIGASLEALASISAIESGARTASNLGDAKRTITVMKNYAEDISVPISAGGMNFLGNLALVESNIPMMIDAGILDVIASQLECFCRNASGPEPRVLIACADLISRISTTEATICRCVQSELIERLIEIASLAYIADAGCMEAVTHIVGSCALVESTRETLLKAGAVELLTDTIDMHPSISGPVSNALSNLGNNNASSIKHITDTLAKEVAGPKNADRIRRMLDEMRSVDVKEDADRVLQAVAHLLESCLKSQWADPELITHALQVAGRCVAASPSTISMATEAIINIADSEGGRDNQGLRERCLQALHQLVDEHNFRNILMNPKFESIAISTSHSAETSEPVRLATQTLVEKLSMIATIHMDVLVNDKENGNVVLSQLMKANKNNSSVIKDLLGSFGTANGDINGLLNTLFKDLDRGNIDNFTTMLRATNKHFEGNNCDFMVADLDTMSSLLNRSLIDGKKISPSGQELLNLLSHGNFQNGLENCDIAKTLLSILSNATESGDSDTAARALAALGRVAAINDTLEELMECDCVGVLNAAMGTFPNDENIQAESLNVINAMGIDNLGMNADMRNAINRALQFFKNNRNIQENGAKLLAEMLSLQGDDNAGLIEASLDALLGAFGDRAGSKRRESDVVNALQKLSLSNGQAIPTIPIATFQLLAQHIDTHKAEPERLIPLFQILGVLTMNEENVGSLVNTHVVQSAIQMLQSVKTLDAFKLATVEVLFRTSKNPNGREQILASKGIKEIIEMMLCFINVSEVVDKCLTILGSLSVRNEPNVAEVLKYNGHGAVQKVMLRYPQTESTLVLCLALLCNLMIGRDANKLVIGKVCGSEVIQTTRLNYANAAIFRSALKALGNLSYLDENIYWIVHEGTTRWIVMGMDAHTAKKDILILAISVLGNFGSFDEDDPAIRDKVDRGEMSSVFERIVMDGGAKQIIDVLNKKDDSSDMKLISCALEALGNMCQSQAVIEKLIKLGVVESLFKSMRKYDWDPEMVACCGRLVALMTNSPSGLLAIGKHDGVQILLGAMESHDTHVVFLEHAAIALKHLSTNEMFLSQIEQLGGVRTTLKIYDQNIEAKDLILEIIAMYVRMSKSEEISEKIAQGGMRAFLKSINLHGDDTSYLSAIYTLIGHLAFAKNNLRVIIQHGGIDLIINSILDHPEDRNLVIRCVQTLDNIAMQSKEQSEIVIQAGGKETIEEVAAAYDGDRDVTNTANSALLSMTQIEKRAKPQMPTVRRHSTSENNPIKPYVSMLKSGGTFVEWNTSGPHTRHVYLSGDMKNICWKDPKKGIKSENRIPLRDIRSVGSGTRDGSHCKKNKHAANDCAFYITGRVSYLDLEAHTSHDRDRWVQALEVLITLYKTNPRMLGY